MSLINQVDSIEKVNDMPRLELKHDNHECIQESIEKTNQQVQKSDEVMAASDSADLPNLELNTVKNINQDNNAASASDDFGSFDDDDDDNDDDDFGSFDGDDNDAFEQEVITNAPIFNTLQDALDTWQELLNQIYCNYKQIDSFTENAPKNIKFYVLEEAPESLRSRLTWDSVTKYMDNDTGKAKVRWNQSEIEKLHLIALSCKRSSLTIMMSPPLSPTTSTTKSNNENIPEPIDTNYNNQQKRSSVFGLSTISRFLPHLSKSNLPKSPTSPISPSQSINNDWIHQPTYPLTPSNSIPRRSVNNDCDQQQHVNHMNTTSTGMRRSNTVAFSSRFKDYPIITQASSSPPSEQMKTCPTSFHSIDQSTDLFELNTILQAPVSPALNTSFKPLIPSFSSTPLSPTIINHPVCHNTLPIHYSDDITTNNTLSVLPTIHDEDFGDFAGEEDLGNDPFDDFFNNKTSVPVTNNDPFGLNLVMMMSASSHARSNSFPTSIPAVTTKLQNVLSPTQVMSHTPIASSPPTPVQQDIFSTKGLSPTNDPFDFSATCSLPSVFDMPAVTDQEEDDDWGDWAF